MNECKNLYKVVIANLGYTNRDFFIFFNQGQGPRFCKHLDGRRPYPEPRHSNLSYISNILLR